MRSATERRRAIEALEDRGLPPDLAALAVQPNTDVGNARRLAMCYRPVVRYVGAWDRWLWFDGKRWREDDTRELDRLAKQVPARLYEAAAHLGADSDREALVKHAVRSESVARIEAMIRLARSEKDIAIRPADLDAGRYLLNVANGTIDLRTGELRPHDSKDLLTKLAPVEWQAHAESPVFDDFLDRIFAGNLDLIRYVQRAVGYSLTGDVSEQVLFFPYGSGANGKSTLLQVILDMMGDYAKPTEPELLLSRREVHPTGVADLRGARMALSTEVGDGRNLNEALVKQLTGGDRVKARFMRQDFFEFEPTHKLWLVGNHKPVIRGTDHAIWRRIRLIPFDVTIPAEEQDKHLLDKLRGELPGILRWAIQGCIAWQQDGLREPPEVLEATREYRSEMDVLGRFLSERCEVRNGFSVGATELFHSYREWLESAGEKRQTQTKFGTLLAERGFEKDRDSATGRTVYFGLRVKPEGNSSDYSEPFRRKDVAA